MLYCSAQEFWEIIQPYLSAESERDSAGGWMRMDIKNTTWAQGPLSSCSEAFSSISFNLPQQMEPPSRFRFANLHSSEHFKEYLFILKIWTGRQHDWSLKKHNVWENICLLVVQWKYKIRKKILYIARHGDRSLIFKQICIIWLMLW